MQRVGSHARVVGVIVINQRKTSAQFLPILYFHVQHCQLCFKKVKWTLIFFFPSLLLLFPTNTQPHTCTHTNTPSTHTRTHARSHTQSPDFHPCGREPSRARSELSWAWGRNTHFSLPVSGSTKMAATGVPQGSVLGPVPFLIRCCTAVLTSRWLAPPFLWKRLRWQSWCSPRIRGAWKLTCRDKACGTRRGTTLRAPYSRPGRRCEDSRGSPCRSEDERTKVKRSYVQAGRSGLFITVTIPTQKELLYFLMLLVTTVFVATSRLRSVLWPTF